MAAETIANRGCDRNGLIRPSKMALPILVFASAVSQLGFVIANPILLDIARSFHLPLPVSATPNIPEDGRGRGAASAFCTRKR